MSSLILPNLTVCACPRPAPCAGKKPPCPFKACFIAVFALCSQLGPHPNRQAEVALCEEKLDRAQKLIGGLGGEKVRWTAAAAELAATYNRLVGEFDRGVDGHRPDWCSCQVAGI